MAQTKAKPTPDIPYMERDALQEVMDYRATLIKPTALDVLVVGNLTPEQAETFSHGLKTRLGLTGTDWRRADKATVATPLQAIIQKRLDSTDSALVAVYVPLGYDRIEGMACSYLLSQNCVCKSSWAMPSLCCLSLSAIGPGSGL